MWKRDEAVRQPAQPAVPTNEAAAAAPAAAAQRRPSTGDHQEPEREGRSEHREIGRHQR